MTIQKPMKVACFLRLILAFICIITMQSSSLTVSEPVKMKGMVDRHNHWRAKVGVPSLVWSDKLADFAQAWAKELARKGCTMKHRPTKGKWNGSAYGENIYWSSGLKNQPADVVDAWASEIVYYDSISGKCKNGVCGHYTQLIWKKTTEVGCGMAKCGNEEIWVCNYNPPGNYIGQKPY